MTTQPIAYDTGQLPQAARLHLARYLAGLEITELARATGISRSTIANYENLNYSKRRTAAYIRLWAMATGASYAWLMGDVPGPGGVESVLDRRNGPSTAFGRVVPFRPGRTPRAA